MTFRLPKPIPQSALALAIALTCGCERGTSPSPVEPPGAGGSSHAPAGAAAPDARRAPVKTLARFRDVTHDAGIEFVYRNGEEAGHFSILESLGGGAAALDYDNDGLFDLFAPGGGHFDADNAIAGLPSALYRNRGDWQFANVTPQAAVAEPRHYSHGAAAADCNNDGFTDVLITGYGGLTLWMNQGDGTFREAADESQLDDRRWSSSAGWGDFNADGHLDLYVAHYVNWSFDNDPVCPGPGPGLREVCPPRSFDPLPDVLYLNGGDGTFRDASAEYGLRPDGKGLGVVIADLDLNRTADVYVANDTVSNFLYRNEESTGFAEIGMISGTSVNDQGLPDGSMGCDVGDFNLDGLPDIWVANYERESFGLYRNEGNCMFRPVSQVTGVTAIGGLYVGWGTLFFDFDLDGDEDLFASNGHVVRYPQNAPLKQLPILMQNREGRWFDNVAENAGEYLTTPHMGRGVAGADFDNDGRVDLAVSHTNDPLALLANESPTDAAWLNVQLTGTISNRSAVGALVRVTVGDRQYARQVKGGSSYASTHDPRLAFGLANAEAVDKLEVHWPAGGVQELRDVSVRQFLHIVESANAQTAAPPSGQAGG